MRADPLQRTESIPFSHPFHPFNPFDPYSNLLTLESRGSSLRRQQPLGRAPSN